jgi:N-acetylglucosamine kinase-like BadF-type ATPase
MDARHYAPVLPYQPYNAGMSRRPPARRSAPTSLTGWAVGVDAGGTWTRVVAVDPAGRPRRRLRVRSGPPLATLLSRAARELGLRRRDVAALVVATRGVWTRSERQAAARRLAPLALRVRVISDVEAAYRAALGDRPGLLLLAGTGAIALAGDGRGRWARAGGLGPLLGDPGSAFAIGRQWLLAASGCESRSSPGRELQARRLARQPDAVARIAQLARHVLERARAGEREARAIVRGAQTALADLGLRAASRLALPLPVSVSWAGGLMADERFRAGVWRAMRRRGCRMRVVEPTESPIHPAARAAAHLAIRT